MQRTFVDLMEFFTCILYEPRKKSVVYSFEYYTNVRSCNEKYIAYQL